MARQRPVTCACGHEWTTRANPRVRLRCPACGEAVLAPPIEDPWRPSWEGGAGADLRADGTDTPGADEGTEGGPAHGAGTGDPSSTPTGTPPAGGVQVSRAAKTTARARRTTPRPAQAPAERPDEALTPHQQAGRRGGLARGTRRRMGRV